jgi:hypothetical protein
MAVLLAVNIKKMPFSTSRRAFAKALEFRITLVSPEGLEPSTR